VTPVAGAGAGIAAALAAFVITTIAQRLFELWRSARHTRRLIARGAVERGSGHYPWIVALHVLYPLALIAEVTWLGARPPKSWPVWLGLWLAAQALRVATMLALGDRWTTRIWVVPGEPLVTRGPYRWMRHPGYLAVLVDLAAGALTFGAWRTAIGISLLDTAALGVRIRAEDEALAGAPPAPTDPAGGASGRRASPAS
jgi:methyltransferase